MQTFLVLLLLCCSAVAGTDPRNVCKFEVFQAEDVRGLFLSVCSLARLLFAGLFRECPCRLAFACIVEVYWHNKKLGSHMVEDAQGPWGPTGADKGPSILTEVRLITNTLEFYSAWVPEAGGLDDCATGCHIVPGLCACGHGVGGFAPSTSRHIGEARDPEV